MKTIKLTPAMANEHGKAMEAHVCVDHITVIAEVLSNDGLFFTEVYVTSTHIVRVRETSGEIFELIKQSYHI